jgi:hypothetical protein
MPFSRVTTLIIWQGHQLEGKLALDFLYFTVIDLTPLYSLSSIMLGRLRLSVDQALDQYKAFGNEVFGKPRRWHERSPFWYPRAKYSSRKTGEAFQNVVLESLQQGEHAAVTESFEDREDRTRTYELILSGHH